MSMLSISSPFAQACIDAVNSSEQRFAGSSGTPEKVSSTDQNIPLTELNQLLTLAQQRKNNDDIGLLAYQKAHPGNLGVLGYAIMSSATILDALKRMVEYHSTVGVGFCMFLEEQSSTVKIAGKAAAPHAVALPRVFIDAATSMTLGLLHWLVPGSRIAPLSAEFTYAKPDDTRLLEELFGEQLTFSAGINALTFRRIDCELPLPTFDPALQSLHDNHLKAQQRELEVSDITTQTRRVILQHLHECKSLALEHVLNSMRLTQRQLASALKTEGETFQNLLDEVKRSYSSQLLRDTCIALKQVAYAAGFKNQSAFNKACERWFKMSPGNYRSAASEHLLKRSD